MQEQQFKWVLRLETQDRTGLIRLLREVDQEMAGHAADSASLMFDDDPDGIVLMSVPINSIDKLCDTVQAAKKDKYLCRMQLSAVINGGGVSASTSINYPLPGERPGVYGDIHLDKQLRASNQDKAIESAIAILHAATM